jgi:hypothetical protein
MVVGRRRRSSHSAAVRSPHFPRMAASALDPWHSLALSSAGPSCRRLMIHDSRSKSCRPQCLPPNAWGYKPPPPPPLPPFRHRIQIRNLCLQWQIRKLTEEEHRHSYVVTRRTALPNGRSPDNFPSTWHSGADNSVVFWLLRRYVVHDIIGAGACVLYGVG